MIGNTWDDALKVIWSSPGFNTFYNKILKLYNEKTIFPAKENIFNALKITDYNNSYNPKIFIVPFFLIKCSQVPQAFISLDYLICSDLHNNI